MLNLLIAVKTDNVALTETLEVSSCYLSAFHTVPDTLHDQFIHFIAFRVKHNLWGREDCFNLE